MRTDSPARGDIDGDGQIGKSDLALLRQVLGESGHGEHLLDKLSPDDRARLDVNGDGVVDHADVASLCTILMDNDTDAARELADRFKALRDKMRP